MGSFRKPQWCRGMRQEGIGAMSEKAECCRRQRKTAGGSGRERKPREITRGAGRPRRGQRMGSDGSVRLEK